MDPKLQAQKEARHKGGNDSESGIPSCELPPMALTVVSPGQGEVGSCLIPWAKAL